MGKGSRNRMNHQVEPQKPEVKKAKPKKFRRKLSEKAKNIITYCVCAALVVGAILGILAGQGTFKRGNVLVKSTDGYDVNQQMATYMVWDALYYTGYYQWSYYSSSIKEATGIQNQSQYCLYYAMSGVQDTLLTSINNYADTLKEYVAVCDVADSFGISLTKEEEKQAREEMRAQIEYMAATNSLSVKGFINYYIGNNVKMKDIEDVAVIQSLYAKVSEKKNGMITDSVTDAIIENYRNENPASFYFTEYYLYSTEDADDSLRPLLKAATTVAEFKEVFLKDVFDEEYRTIYNKYATSINTLADETLAAVEKKTTVEELNTALASKEMTIATYSKNDDTLPQKLVDWMFSSERAQFNAAKVTAGDKIYIVVLASTATAEETISAAIKEFALESGESYGEGEKADPEFKTNIYNTLKVEYEIVEKADGMKLYDESDDEKIQKMLADLEAAVNKVMPAVKTQYYVKEPEADSYQDWMFDANTVISPVKAGAVKEFTKTENKNDKEITTYSIYAIVDPMKLNTDPQVDGGFIKFEGEGHEAKAQAFLDSLAGKTGDELKKLFEDAEDSNLSETFSEENVADELAAWMFASERKADDTGMIKVANTAKEDEKDNSCTYVALYRSSTETWKNNSKSSYIQQEMTNWVEGLIKDYPLEGMKFIKDKNPPVTEETTTAATTTAAA